MLKNSLNIIIWIGLSLLAAFWVSKKTDWFKPAADKALTPAAATMQPPLNAGSPPQYAPGNANNAYSQGYGYNGGNGNVGGNGYGDGRANANMNFGFNGGGNASGYGRGYGYN